MKVLVNSYRVLLCSNRPKFTRFHPPPPLIQRRRKQNIERTEKTSVIAPMIAMIRRTTRAIAIVMIMITWTTMMVILIAMATTLPPRATKKKMILQQRVRNLPWMTYINIAWNNRMKRFCCCSCVWFALRITVRTLLISLFPFILCLRVFVPFFLGVIGIEGDHIVEIKVEESAALSAENPSTALLQPPPLLVRCLIAEV